MVNTEDMSTASYQAALQVAQQAISALVRWANPDEQLPLQSKGDQNVETAVTRAKAIFKWTETMPVGALRLLFDLVKLREDAGQPGEYWHPMEAIADTDPKIPYPLLEEPDSNAQTKLKEQIQTEVVSALHNQANWNNLALLSLILEKYGSCLSFGEDNVALVDLARITGAAAAALAPNPEATHLSLVAGDLSGIQKFIYTISSEGALKSLRARSFYLELVTEEVVQQLLKELQLPRSSVIYAGGGNIYLIAYTDEIQKKVSDFQIQFNNWLLDQFQGKVYLAIDSLSFPIEQVNSKLFEEQWDKVIRELNKQKNHKFESHIISSDFLQPKDKYSERCRVCHRDDTTDLNRLSEEEGSILACPICRKIYWLGDQLFNTRFLVRTESKKDLSDSLVLNAVSYRLLRSQPQQLDGNETLLVINDWSLGKYQQAQTVPLLLGNYGQKVKDDKSKNDRFIRALEMAERATGIDRVGYLRMDVDRLGQIFAKGLGDNYSLSRLAGLSRQMSYFFKVYLNSLAEHRKENFLNYEDRFCFESLGDGDRPNLLFIYAGGDDLFVSGAWNEVVEFAFDVYQSFRAYTGYNSDITLSGGISIDDIKFPLYQSAEASKKLEDLAKGNGRDSLGLFSTALKWDEWLGSENSAEKHRKILSIIHQDNEDYWKKANPETEELKLLGVLPFVTRIQKQRLQPNYSRNFVKNLLAAAQLQEQRIKEIERKRKLPEYDDQIQDLRYYLHLPQIAYTLARLPKEVFKDDDFRKSIKHPYNAPYFRAIATWIELLHRRN